MDAAIRGRSLRVIDNTPVQELDIRRIRGRRLREVAAAVDAASDQDGKLTRADGEDLFARALKSTRGGRLTSQCLSPHWAAAFTGINTARINRKLVKQGAMTRAEARQQLRTDVKAAAVGSVANGVVGGGFRRLAGAGANPLVATAVDLLGMGAATEAAHVVHNRADRKEFTRCAKDDAAEHLHWR